MGRPLALGDGLNKLQEFLLAMAHGDQLSANRASDISGLDPKRCEALLDALMRAGVMMRLQHGTYVRCRLEPTGQPLNPVVESTAGIGKAAGLIPGNP
jgi:predicted transcriptional regulator of viral defense system